VLFVAIDDPEDPESLIQTFARPDIVKEDSKEHPDDKVEPETEFQDTPFDRYKQA